MLNGYNRGVEKPERYIYVNSKFGKRDGKLSVLLAVRGSIIHSTNIGKLRLRYWVSGKKFSRVAQLRVIPVEQYKTLNI